MSETNEYLTKLQTAAVILANPNRTKEQERELVDFITRHERHTSPMVEAQHALGRYHWQHLDIESARMFQPEDTHSEDFDPDMWYISLTYHALTHEYSKVLRTITFLGPFGERTARQLRDLLSRKRTLATDRLDPYMIVSDRGGEAGYVRTYLPQLCRALAKWNKAGESAEDQDIDNSETFAGLIEKWIRPRCPHLVSETSLKIEAVRVISEAALFHVAEHH